MELRGHIHNGRGLTTGFSNMEDISNLDTSSFGNWDENLVSLGDNTWKEKKQEPRMEGKLLEQYPRAA